MADDTQTEMQKMMMANNKENLGFTYIKENHKKCNYFFKWSDMSQWQGKIFDFLEM